MTDQELQAKGAEWQKILRLQDWDIVFKFKKGYDMKGSEGEASWILAHKEALVKILFPEDYDPDSVYEQDIDRTIAHELLHIHFAMIDDHDKDSAEYISMHQAIDAIAKSLADLYHKCKPSVNAEGFCFGGQP